MKKQLLIIPAILLILCLVCIIVVISPPQNLREFTVKPIALFGGIILFGSSIAFFKWYLEH